MTAEQPGPVGDQATTVSAWLDEYLDRPLELDQWQRDLLDLTYARWARSQEDHARFRERMPAPGRRPTGLKTSSFSEGCSPSGVVADC